MNPFTDESAAAGRRAAALERGKTARQIFTEARLDLAPETERLVLDRLSQMPQTCVRTYLKALRGRSMQAGIAANCAMCLGWDNFRDGIRNCSDPSCPLYPYRPYQ